MVVASQDLSLLICLSDMRLEVLTGWIRSLTQALLLFHESPCLFPEKVRHILGTREAQILYIIVMARRIYGAEADHVAHDERAAESAQLFKVAAGELITQLEQVGSDKRMTFLVAVVLGLASCFNSHIRLHKQV